MKKVKSIVTILVGFAIGQAFAGLEAENALEQINNSVALGVSGQYLDYKESFLPIDVKPGGMPKSTESGIALGCFFDIRKAFAENIYTELFLDYHNDKLKYDGTLQVDANTPFVGKFWHRFFNANVKVGYIFNLTDNHTFQIIPYAGGGYRFWYRG